MNTESKEHLSTLMDGEINRETGRFMIRRLGADSELQETWSRYHLIRDCLRHQDGGLAAEGLSERIQQALVDETPQKAPVSVTARWFKPVAGVAIAASVALMAVFAVTPGQQSLLAPSSEGTEISSTESFTSPNILSRGPISQQASLSGGRAGNTAVGQNEGKINAYLLRHYQVAGSAGGKGFVSFVPIVVAQAAVQNPEPKDQQSRDNVGDSEGESVAAQR